MILSEIDRALQANDMALAARLARDALAAGHVHPALFNLRAYDEKQMGNLQSALADLQRAQELSPGSAWTLCDIAECLNGLGQHDKALSAAGRATVIDPSFARSWFHKGVAHQALLQFDKARASYAAAIQRDPGLVDGHARLAMLAAEFDRWDDARRHAAGALAVSPGHALAIVALATADLAEHKLDDAERRLKALLSRRDIPPPVRAMVIAQMGDVCDLKGDVDEAFRAYRDARTIWADFYVPQLKVSEGVFGGALASRMASVLGGAASPPHTGLSM